MVAATSGGAHKKDPDFGKVRIFVYGTLKMSKPNNIVLRKSGGTCLGYDSVTVPSGALMDMGQFPGLIHPIEGNTESSQIVKGEIWYGEPEILRSCDILEGHPLFYRRRKHWSNILKRRVWVYALNSEWIAEGEDFMSESCWQPTDLEKAFWKEQEAA